MLQVELSASGQLANGRWQASGSAAGVQVGRLAQVPPALQAPLSGTFKLSGTTESFKPETIRATGSGRVNIAGGTVTASNIQLAGGLAGVRHCVASNWDGYYRSYLHNCRDASTVGSTCRVVWLRLHPKAYGAMAAAACK